jgi:hypothetical protein
MAQAKPGDAGEDRPGRDSVSEATRAVKIKSDYPLSMIYRYQ